MTVAELIEHLQQLPPDTPVVAWNSGWWPVIEVSLLHRHRDSKGRYLFKLGQESDIAIAALRIQVG